MTRSTSLGTLKSYLGTVFAALGLAEIYCLALIAPLVHFRHTAVYHWHGKPLDLFLPVVLDVVVVWVLVGSLLLLAYQPGRTRNAVWLGILLFAPAVVSNDWDLLYDALPHPLTSWLFIGALTGYVLLWLFWYPSFAKQLDCIIEITSAGLLFIGIGGALLLCQIAWFGWQARALNAGLPLHHPIKAPSTGARRRIIWVVFDELSYQQVYGRRYQGLELPAFDALAATSTVFTHVIPAGLFTDSVLPSLISGQLAATVRSSPAGRLAVRHPDMRGWQPFDQHATVFQDALDAGYSTAVVGWYIPYCRIMPDVLDTCFWDYEARIRNGMFSSGSLMTNMLQPLAYATENVGLRRLLRRLFAVDKLAVRDKKLHIEDYQLLSEAADNVLLDRSRSFVLLHLPVPHLAAIYDRKKGQLTTGPSTYLDNLVLADRSLAHFRTILEQSGQWDSSTFIVMGDHSWRTTQISQNSSLWTTEEEKASHGGEFDERPFYTVKLSGQRAGSLVDTRFSALNTRALLDSILKGKIQSLQELFVWSSPLCCAQRNSEMSSGEPEANAARPRPSHPVHRQHPHDR